MAKRETLERPMAVKDLLERFLKPGDWQALHRRRLIREVWERVVPASLVEQTRLVEVRRQELWVEVRASPWVQELQFLKPKILAEFDRVLGQGVIRDVRFSIG